MSNVVTLKSNSVRAQLRAAQTSGELVRLWRNGLEAGSFAGYVLDVGNEYVLLWVVGDFLGFDGIFALRHRDVTELEAPDKNAGFIEKAMALKGVTRDTLELPSGVLDSATELLQWMALQSNVLSVHVDTEETHEVCYVGRFVGFDADGFQLQEITPDAEWMHELSMFGLEEISAISFDGPYNEALSQIAGQPPDDLRPPRNLKLT